ncbi:MAG: Gfo/Idh/MocA family oxidoreductase [Armatimonadota bacterium]|nr:Gfo/Idh/MocA family oxidoreductase [Armatimonadota bacterium]
MSDIRLGVLGFAHGHVNMYCQQWLQRPELGARLVAGWDHDSNRAAANCASFKIEQAPSVDALLGRDDVDAVVIASETSMHANMVEAAAAAGKAILLQKPFALTMEQADRIVTAVERSGVPFTMAWQMRVDPHNLRVKSLLETGEFGRIFMVRRRHCLPTQLMKDFDKTWHVQPELNRDIFADDAAHPIDFLYWLLGMPVSVFAEMGTLLNPAIPNDNGIAVFRFADGAFGEASCTFVAVAGENTLEVVCEHGVIVGNYGDLPSCSVPRPPGGIQLKWYLDKVGDWTISDIPDIMGQGERISGLAAPLAEYLHGNRPPIATAEEGRDVLRMTLACYESADQGRRVQLRNP